MDFATAYFGRSLDDLEYNDIVNYFAEPKQETETIEFKSYHVRTTFDAGLQNVIRGISAFLNSSGGILVWGAPSAQQQQGQPESIFVGQLSPVTELQGKDRLINRISSAIVPLPIGIAVKILESDGAYIYVFEVQPSIYKPHQYDTRYYVRLDGQTKPAPHYLIEALMNRVSFPNISGVIKFHDIIRETDRRLIPITVGLFNFSELQNEESISFRVLIVGGMFPRSRNPRNGDSQPRYNMKGQQLIFDEFATVLHLGTPNIHEDVIEVQGPQTLHINLSFGGKHSPAKTSSYTLDLTNFYDLHPNDLLTDSKENILYTELNREHNNTPESILSFFTGRLT